MVICEDIVYIYIYDVFGKLETWSIWTPWGKAVKLRSFWVYLNVCLWFCIIITQEMFLLHLNVVRFLFCYKKRHQQNLLNTNKTYCAHSLSHLTFRAFVAYIHCVAAHNKFPYLVLYSRRWTNLFIRPGHLSDIESSRAELYILVYTFFQPLSCTIAAS